MSFETDFPMVVGDLLPVLRVTLIGADGVTPLDLTTAISITFSMRLNDDSSPAVGGACTPVGNPTTGVVDYPWKAGDTDIGGEYDIEWIVVYPAGPMTVPPRCPERIRIREHV